MKFKAEIPNIIMIIIANVFTIGLVFSIANDWQESGGLSFEGVRFGYEEDRPEANVAVQGEAIDDGINLDEKMEHILTDFDALRIQISTRIHTLIEEANTESEEVDTPVYGENEPATETIPGTLAPTEAVPETTSPIAIPTTPATNPPATLPPATEPPVTQP